MTQELVTRSTDIIELGITGLSEYSLAQLTRVASAVDRADKLVKLAQGIILIAARDKHKDDISFGFYRSNVFPDMDKSVAGKLMNLARFFNSERPMLEIKYSAALIISAPKNESIAEQLYEDVKMIAGGASIKQVNEAMQKLALPSVNLGETLSETIKRDVEAEEAAAAEKEEAEVSEMKEKQAENQQHESPIEDPIDESSVVATYVKERTAEEKAFSDFVNLEMSIEASLLVIGVHNEPAFLRNDPYLGGHIDALAKYYKHCYSPDNGGDSKKLQLVNKAVVIIKAHYNVK